MAIQIKTLYDAVKDKEEYGLTLVTGEAGLSKPVSWVHLVERMELATFLEGRELVITTGMALQEPEELVAIVEIAFQNGASGFLINTGPYIPSIPQEVEDFCSRHDLPLFEVPWRVYIAKIMKTFCELITLSDRTITELSTAAHNAIFFPAQEENYIPAFEQHDYDKEWPYCAAVFDLGDSVGLEKWRQWLEGELASHNMNGFAFLVKEHLVAVFANEEIPLIRVLCDSLLATVQQACGETVKIYCGIGRNTKSIRCLYKSYDLACKILRSLRHDSGGSRAVTYDELGVDKLLIGMNDTEIQNEFIQSVLGPLLEYDQAGRGDYISFLYVFFQEGGNIQSTADRLYVHRNSVNYKLRRIGEILGCDLSQLETKLELSLALRLLKVL